MDLALVGDVAGNGQAGFAQLSGYGLRQVHLQIGDHDTGTLGHKRAGGAAPMPLAPPVITATFPAKRSLMKLSSV